MRKKETIQEEAVVNKIYLVRGHKVMLDMDLAQLYGVETKQFKRSVKRNMVRFPEDFMFELTVSELRNLRCQIGTSSSKENWGGTRYVPMAFTEQGVAMLSSILNSERAVLVNIHIIRIFTRMRALLYQHKEILLKLELLEKKVTQHDEDIQRIFDYLKELLSTKDNAQPIGFKYNKT